MNVLVKPLHFLLLSDSTPTISHKHLLKLKDLANKGKSQLDSYFWYMTEGLYHERGTSSLAHKLRIGVYVTLLRMKQTKADLRDYQTRGKLCEYRARVIIAYPNNHRKISVASLESIRRHMNKIKTNSSLIPLYWNRSINRKPQTVKTSPTLRVLHSK